MNFKKLAIGIMAFGLLILIVGGVGYAVDHGHSPRNPMPIGTALIIVGLIIFFSAEKKQEIPRLCVTKKV